MTADVLVVGAGPAGSATALLLARRGLDVLVLERAVFPRPKACGECLNPGAVTTLARLGLLDVVLALAPATLEGWELRAGDARGAAAFPKGAGAALALPRASLDAALLEAALREGARAQEGVNVRALGPRGADGGRTLEVREPDGRPGTRSARFVVGADGLRSVVARSLGGPRRPARLRKLSLTLRVRGRVRRSPGSERMGLLVLSAAGTVGFAPVARAGDLWNLTVVVDAERWGRQVAADPLSFALSAAERAGLDWREGPEVLGGPWASGPFDRPMRRVAAPGVALVGDAAGYYDPLTGQGIFRALRSAELAAPAIDRALSRGRVSGDLSGYRVRHRIAFAAGGLLQRAVEAAVSRKTVREPLVSFLGARPPVLSTLFAVTGDASPPSRLLSPRTIGRLMLPARRHTEACAARLPADDGRRCALSTRG